MATALPSSCEEQQSNNLDEYSDDSEAESEKVRKAKKSKKPGNLSIHPLLVSPPYALFRPSSFVAAQQLFTNVILHYSH